MIFDVLGIFIGFSAIMLLFSLLVTAIVHGAQAGLSLRFKNLKTVITAFLSKDNHVSEYAIKSILKRIEERNPHHLYATALPINVPGNQLKITRINVGDLKRYISECDDLSDQARQALIEKVENEFELVEEVMSQRFKQWMHQISIVVAFCLSILFQLNSFQLLHQLHTDSYFRLQMQHLGEQQIDASKQDDITPLPVDALQAHLASFKFEVRPAQWSDYYFSWQLSTLGHWLGILFSTILISFGAPFWFNRLKDLISLRDRLSSRSGGTQATPNSSHSP